jgi:hypothetical protein
MKIEKIEDLLEIDTEKLKAAENKRLLTKLKQLIKAGNKSEAKADEAAKDLPYIGVGVVGNRYVEIGFDLDSKEGRVVDVAVHTTDVKNNYMAGARAMKKVQELVKEYRKELVNPLEARNE